MKDIIARLARENLHNDLGTQAILQELREHPHFGELVTYLRCVDKYELPSPGEETFWHIFELIHHAQHAINQNYCGWNNA